MGLLKRANSELNIRQAVAERLIENDTDIFETIEGMCTEETRVDIDNPDFLKRYPAEEYDVYRMKNGVYVICENKKDFPKKDVWICTGDISIYGKLTEAVVYASKDKDNNICSIDYIYLDSDISRKNGAKDIFVASAHVGSGIAQVSGKPRREGNKVIPDYSDCRDILSLEGETIIDLIKKKWESSENDVDRDIADIILNDFGMILDLVPERKIDRESDLEITYRALQCKLKQREAENSVLKSENSALVLEEAKLKSANKTLNIENSKLINENTAVQRRYLELMETLRRVKEFIVHKCSKIPFVGKRILAEMNKELKINEISDGRLDER